MHLRDNNLYRRIQLSPQNYPALTVVDLDLNELPKWIGINLSGLIIFSLRSDKLNGHITFELLSFTVWILPITIDTKVFQQFQSIGQCRITGLQKNNIIKPVKKPFEGRIPNLYLKGNYLYIYIFGLEHLHFHYCLVY